MPPERITITVTASPGGGGIVSAAEELRQVLDLFELLTIAQGSMDGEVVAWRLVSILKQSPLTATGEAYAMMTGVSPEIVARRGKERLREAFDALTAGESPPEWLHGLALTKTRSLLQRNVNGIGRTDIDYEHPAREPTIIVERTARLALLAIEKDEIERRVATEDLSRTEIGSIEGTVAGVTTHHGRPAVDVRESLRRQVIRCVLSEQAAEELKATHNWGEVWEGQRVLVEGEIAYKRDGSLSRMSNAQISLITVGPINYDDIARPGILGGLTPRAYLDAVWGDDDDG